MRTITGMGRTPRLARPFRPRLAESLEERLAPAIDLTGVATVPYGVLNAGLQQGGGAGFSVAEAGDVNGDGFDDYLVGSPGITAPTQNGALFDLNATSAGRVYLVFGSRQVNNPSNVDFATLTALDRIGDLSQLGNINQNNPVTGSPGFAFDGLIFTAGQNARGQLGASVAAVGDVNGDGFADFMIGAPGANDLNLNNAGTGRAYLIYGGANLIRPNPMVDLDNQSANQDLNIITFVNSLPGARTGRGVGSAGDMLTDGFPDIVIGAPGASLAGLNNNGAAYVVSGAFLQTARTATVNLATVGQAGANLVPGIIFAGANPGDEAGTSVANAGNVDGVTAAGLQTSDLLIGAPAGTTNGRGIAFLVYGSPTLANLATPVSGVNLISLGAIGTGLPGAAFVGSAAGDVTGFAVSTAGDFNGDGLSDFLIGSPGFQSQRGRATLVFGQPSTAPLLGLIPLDSPLTSVASVDFIGASAGALAGYSVTATGRINNDTLNEIAIGSPGVAAGAGAVYLIPGNPDLIGIVPLLPGTVESTAVAGQVITLAQPLTPNFLGTSVSGRLVNSPAGLTIDGDGVGDLIVGAAGYSLNTGRQNAGAAFALEGRFIPLAVPVSTAISSNVSVGTTVAPPYQVNATTPADLTVCILSTGSSDPLFTPSQIDPTTIAVNGVPLPDPTTYANAGDLDNDGIDDYCFVFTPRTLLGLTTATTTLTVTARTLPTAPLPNRRYSGETAIQVVGGGGGGGGGLPGPVTNSFGIGFRPAPPPYGERFVPSLTVLGRAQYKPLPVPVAINQYLPKGNFRGRLAAFYHGRSTNTNFKTLSLHHGVFTRGKFHNGKLVPPPVHKIATIPPTRRSR